MTIAVHISAGRHETLSDNFNFVCFSALALSRPESHFIFIFDSAPSPEIYLEPNCTPVILLPTLKNNLLRHYWYNYKLPAIIKRYNVDVCITNGLTCSLRLSIPQCMVASRRNLDVAEKNLYSKRFLSAFAKKAAHLFCIDEHAAETIKLKFGTSTKVSQLYPGLKNEATPLGYEEREAIKEEFTSGNEYFLHLISNLNAEKVKTVLKAFSILKKWQKSSMRMVLITPPKLEEALLKELALYKYREDVLLIAKKDLTTKLINGAYALLAEDASLLTPTLRAMKSGIPVILAKNQNIKRLFPASLETNWDEKSIAEKMMMLYKDESMRSQIVQTGLADSAKYSWENTTKKIWDVLVNLTHSQTA